MTTNMSLRAPLWLLLAAMVCLLAVGCKPAPDVTRDWAEMPSEYRPALWKVSKNGQHGYLFGSMHALPHGLDWLGAPIQQALDNSGTLVLEIDARREEQPIAETFKTMGSTPGIPPVDERIAVQWRDDYAAIADKADLPDNAFKGRESWAAALSLAGIAAQGLGVSRDYGVEAVMTEEARKRSLSIVALESAEEQFGYFDRLSNEHQTLLLEAVIEDAATAKESYRELLANWLTGDVTALAETAQSGMLATEPVRDALLVQRNRAWIAPLIQLVEQDKRPFVAVGAAHVAGKDSVQAMLAQQGFLVERIQ